MPFYGDHIVVTDSAVADGSMFIDEARLILMDLFARTLPDIKGEKLLSFELIEKDCDLLGFFFEDDLAACPSAGPNGDGPHFHMGWKAEIV